VKRKAIGNPRNEDVAAAPAAILERGAPIMRDEVYGLPTAQGMVITTKLAMTPQPRMSSSL
jgi:hypothetical protein